jgi:hypothetical protein
MGQGKKRGTQKRNNNWAGNNTHMPFMKSANQGMGKGVGSLNSLKNSSNLYDRRKYHARKQRQHKAWLRRHNQ